MGVGYRLVADYRNTPSLFPYPRHPLSWVRQHAHFGGVPPEFVDMLGAMTRITAVWQVTIVK